MRLYLDACTLLPLFIEEPSSARLRAFLLAAEEEIGISTLSVGEFGSSISRLTRMDKIDRATARAVLDRFDAWRTAAVASVEILPADIRQAGLLVREPVPKLLVPDAIHLAACKRTGMTLLTLDGPLAEIARGNDVAVIVP